MSESHSHSTHTATEHATHTSHAEHSHAGANESMGHKLNHVAAEEHKAARAARKVDSTVYMTQVLTSGNPKRIEKYFLRKMAYKFFAKLMGKTINRI